MKPYFQNDSVTLYHGDCFEVMRELQGPFDAAITDPPYGIGECKWDVSVDCAALHAALRTACKPGAAKVLFANMCFAARLIDADPKAFRYDLVYQKSSPCGFLNARVAPLRAHENICIFYDRRPTYNPQMWQSTPYSRPLRRAASENYTNGVVRTLRAIPRKAERFPLSVIRIANTVTVRIEEKMFHPTQKPVAAFEWLIRTYTNEGETVLDPFAGSGTAGVAAMRAGRKAVLIELEEKYCELAAKRLAALASGFGGAAPVR